jgi:hypothetical protein
VANSVKYSKPFKSKVVCSLVPKENGTELQPVHDGLTAHEDFVVTKMAGTLA